MNTGWPGHLWVRVGALMLMEAFAVMAIQLSTHLPVNTFPIPSAALPVHTTMCSVRRAGEVSGAVNSVAEQPDNQVAQIRVESATLLKRTQGPEGCCCRLRRVG